ncbi:OLC1v1022022C1 [Oldenlandia corymbosa var. corymbosa]|uniref:OLC1v1022022C1 n=1 Tax=Oldenlandia corymbosa var. corymbosa TaxID=529605 RepID=A0AAV1BWX7_OLDCO|nr:OLC1v1022022C1 [Oldenlandia corymbosa var. corymbosa]
MAAIFASLSAPPIISFTEKATSIKELHQAQAYMIKTGISHDPFSISRLISVASKTSHETLPYAYSLFAEFPQPNTYMYNTLIRAYALSPSPNFSWFLFLKLLQDEEHLFPDKLPRVEVVSWNALLSVYVEKGLLDLAVSLFREMPVKDVESWNFMLSGYVTSGLVDEARRMFDEMMTKDVVSWNIMITGYANAGKYDEVLLLFKDMQRSTVKPDNRTIVTLLSSCASTGAWQQGKWLHAYIDRNGLEVQGFLATALVDMYAKCGCIEKAREIFYSTSKKDVSTWNAMIAGLSIHGYGRDAIKVFSEMVSNAFKPNEVTFVSLLSACSRAGLLEEAQEIFSNMFSLYGITPQIEHYGCMVDLLGRFGLLSEAAELVAGVPEKEAHIMWESLLSACRNHDNGPCFSRIFLG